ncbi:MAG: BTAD domain-containing putative transcriptional regulator, partial [Propionibacteriaceae bacterium]
MTGVLLRLLGPLEVVGHDQLVTPPPGRVASVLSLLAMEAGRVVSLDRLMDQLWEETPASGAATLHVYVSRLRRLLTGTDVRIVTRSPGYLLDLPRAAVDAHLLADRLAEADQAAADGRWQLTLTLAGQARELWRGDPFVDAYRSADLAIEAERLEKQYARLDELAARALLELGRPAEAYPVADGLTRRDRLNETYWWLRIRAAQRSGNAATALADVEEFRELLADELGLDPSERMTQLQLEILRGDGSPAVAPTAPTVTYAEAPVEPPIAPEATAALTPARAEQRADLDAGVAGALAGTGTTVILEGEPGIGKSFLAGYAAAEARAADVRVVWSRAMDGPGTPALWMWEQVLGSLGADQSSDRPSGADELRSLAEAQAAATEGSDPEQARFRLSEAIVARVQSASRRQPLLLVFDDVQWADDSTLYTLRLLAQAVPELPCAMVLTARTGASHSQLLEATLAAMAREPTTVRHRLEPFSLPEVQHYLAARAGDGALDHEPGQVALLHQRSGGNPFFLGELLRSGANGARAPSTVTGLVEQRRSQLGEQTRAVLDLAAVAGSSFDALVVAKAMGQPLLQALAVMEPAVEEGFVVIDPESRSWRFAHDLAREA